MQQCGLEWFFRFIMEPGRLWKRYFVHDLPVFMRLVAYCALRPSHQASSIVLERVALDMNAVSIDGHPIVGKVSEAEGAALAG
jgi:hypothetical protein